jgi:hypothetical protein
MLIGIGYAFGAVITYICLLVFFERECAFMDERARLRILEVAWSLMVCVVWPFAVLVAVNVVIYKRVATWLTSSSSRRP